MDAAGYRENAVSQPDQVLVTDMEGSLPVDSGIVSPEFSSVEAAFLALEAPLLAYALRLLKEPNMAQDIVQEAFVRLHADFAQVQDPRRWLYRTVHNLALNQLRKSSKVIPLNPGPDQPETDVADPQLLPDEQLVRIEQIGLVRLSLDALDDRSRELIHFKFNDDLSYKQMSERTGLTVSHVGYLLHHAIKAVEAELGRIGGLS
jgi:RNA polymerase sigma factor (sigma-70 family)